MVIKSFFTDKGIPKTGLIPVITIRKVSDSSVVVNAQNMTEVASGWYKYTFSNDPYEEYYVNIDGTIILKDDERYQYGIIEKDLVTAISDETEDYDARIV